MGRRGKGEGSIYRDSAGGGAATSTWATRAGGVAAST